MVSRGLKPKLPPKGFMPLDLAASDYPETDQQALQHAFEQLEKKQQTQLSWMTTRLLSLHADAKTTQTALVMMNPALQTQFPETKTTVENITRLQKAIAMSGLEEKTKAIQKILMSMASDVRLLL